MAYLHGSYGERTASKVKSTAQVDEIAVYFGTAPINLIRGYDDADLVNVPVRLRDIGDAQAKVGYSDNWEPGTGFTLCEAMDYHFNNTVQNVGPIYVINVLDPDVHRKAQATKETLTFSNGRASFLSDTVILDTLAIAEKVEGVDYAVDYNFTSGKVTITSLNDSDRLDGEISVSFFEVDPSMVETSDIIGQKSQSGEYSGIASVALMYLRHNAITNILAAPGWSDIPEVYRALCSAAQKINGHWDGFVNADIPLEDGGNDIDTIAKAIAWKEQNGYTSEISKVYWPMSKNAGKVYHLSTVATATMMATDMGHNAVPCESPSNEDIMATAQYFGEKSKNQGFDQMDGNTLNEKGITTLIYWEGSFKLWGPHTAAFQYNGSMDAAAIFDNNIRMLMHCTNGFQKRNGTQIDAPMSPNDRDSIVISEQGELDAYKGVGALIGDPEIIFLESENPTSNMVNGDFVFNILATPTPPMKSAKAKVTYTDEGFSSFFGEEA